MMADQRPPYAGLLIDGRLPTDSRTFGVQEGQRIRFRYCYGGKLAGGSYVEDTWPGIPDAERDYMFVTGTRPVKRVQASG